MKLILFGAGILGQEAYDFLGEDQVFCFCDNAVKNGERKFLFQKNIMPFDKYKEIYQNYITIVCLGYNFCMEVCEQLNKAGVKDYLIYERLKESGKTADEFIRLFQDRQELDKLYKDGYKYLLHRTRMQLQYLKRHVDIKTLKPAVGDFRKHQLELIQRVSEFFEFVNDLNISPFLIFGNLIGAVRHHGFIPWDDDFDFGLIRSEYEKLLLFAQEQCAVLIYCGDYWIDTCTGNIVEKNKICQIYPNTYIFNLRPNFIQIGKSTEFGQQYVMDIWVYDFYKNQYDINEHMKWVREINSEVKKIENNKDKVDFIRSKQKELSVVSNEMTENFFPGIDNSGGFPGIISVDSWIPTKDIFPLKKIIFEYTEFLAPNKPETLLKYQYKDYMEFPDDMGIITHAATEAE